MAINKDIEITLEKALDKSKLVQVQVQVHSKTGVFYRMQWKNPADVKSTDIIVGNQAVLDKWKKDQQAQSAQQQSAASKFDKSEFDKLKSTDKKQAMEYAKKCGVSWTEHDNQNINWMRCTMAISKLPDNSSNTASLTLTGLDSSFDSKDKKSKIAELLKNNSRQQLMDYAKANGLTWKEDANNAGINWMRASMALQKFLETKSVQDLQSTTIQTSPNQQTKNATKDQNNTTKDDSLLDIPSNATERQKAIINLANSLTDESVIKSFTSIGMIGEDEVSTDYIINTLIPNYETWVKIYGSSDSGSGKKTGISGKGAYYLSQSFLDAMKVEGYKKDRLVYDIRNSLYMINDTLITDPRSAMCSGNLGAAKGHIASETYSDSNFAFTVMVEDLLKGFSTYADNTDELCSNHPGEVDTRWGGTDDEIPEFDEEKDGFCKAINRIAESEPSVKKTCDEIVTYYKEMMGICGNNPKIMYAILTSSGFKTDDKDTALSYGLQNNFNRAEKTANIYHELSTVLPQVMDRLGLSDKAKKNTLQMWNGSLNTFEIYDDHYVVVDLVDLNSLKDDNGELLLKYTKGNRSVNHSLRDSLNYGHPDRQVAKAIALSKVTEDDFLKVKQLFHKITNTGVVGMSDIDDMSINDWNKLEGKSNELSVNPDSDRDFIFTNLRMMGINHQMNDTLSKGNVNCVSSKINDYGNDYTGNFKYYTQYHDWKNRLQNLRYPGQMVQTLTPGEVNKAIDEQLKSTPILSKSAIDKVRSRGHITAGKYSEGSTHSFNSQEFFDDPMREIYMEQVIHATSHISKAIGSKDYKTYKANMIKKLNKGFSNNPQKPVNGSNKLKQLRQELVSKTNCTISVEDEATSLQMRKDFLKNWDYDGVSHHKLYDGSGYAGADRRALFNSRFFKVKNSSFEKGFEKAKQTTGCQPMEVFHATSRASTAGIIGASGKFRFGLTSCAKAFGNGAYFGKKGGKSAVYCTEYKKSYSGIDYGKNRTAYADGVTMDGQKYAEKYSNGCYVLCNILTPDNDNKVKVVDSGSRVREWEAVIANNDYILPHHFVDVSVRSLTNDYGGNVSRDSNGNYVDSNGVITHDRYGTKIGMK